MLEQVIVNLAVNARDAMPKGGRLALRTSVQAIGPDHLRRHAQAREGEFVCLEVSDTGCGMDEATLQRIFEPFFTTKEPGKGTGLGLATAFGIVKQHQGWIQVASTMGQGTTFQLFFPSSGQALGGSAVGASSPAPQARVKGVLLVEDEAELRQLTKAMIEQLGYPVMEAASGQEALLVWHDRNREVDVLIADFVMPDGLTGLELADRLRREKEDLGIVLTSGYTADKLAGKFKFRFKADFQFLQKPYRLETLGQAITKCLVKENQS
jgi:CheY-like chemotaxis protein